MQAGIWQNSELIALIAFVLSVLLVASYLIKKLYAHFKKPCLSVALTPSQKCFYGSLCQISARRAIVLSNVSVAQLSGFRPQCSKWSANYKKLQAQKFDFVLCSRSNYSSLAVIEFEGDKSPNKVSVDVEEICRNNNITVFRVPASSVTKLDEIEALLYPGEPVRFVRLDSGFQVPARCAAKENKRVSSQGTELS